MVTPCRNPVETGNPASLRQMGQKLHKLQYTITQIRFLSFHFHFSSHIINYHTSYRKDVEKVITNDEKLGRIRIPSSVVVFGQITINGTLNVDLIVFPRIENEALPLTLRTSNNDEDMKYMV